MNDNKMGSKIILKGFEKFPNFRVSDLPEVITPKSLKHRNGHGDDSRLGETSIGVRNGKHN